MLQAGTLRKRPIRNLAKVNGLSTIPYNSSRDTFAVDQFTTCRNNNDDRSSEKILVRSGQHSALQMSSSHLASFRRASNNSNADTKSITSYHTFRNTSRTRGFDQESILDEDGFSMASIYQDEASEAILANRSHFLNKNSIQRLKQVVFVGAMFGTFPWKWNKESYRLDKRSDWFEKLWQWQMGLGVIQAFTLCIFQLYVFFQSFRTPDLSNRNRFISACGFSWSFCNVAFRLNIYGDTLIQCRPLFFNCMSQIPFGALLYLSTAFQPWYVISYLGLDPKIAWYWLIPGTFHELVTDGVVMTHTYLILWIIVTHTNSLQFWLREIHNNNDSDYTSDELRRPENAVATYKTMMVLNKLFNECMAPLAIPSIKIALASSIIPCGFVFIRSINQLFIDEFPGAMTYPFGVLYCCTQMFIILTLVAEVFDLGCSCIQSWYQTKHQYFRRVLMSCPTLKIYSGTFYFITVSTTITFFHTISSTIIDCVITFP